MAVRLLTYVGLLYQDLIKSRQLPDPPRLPPVLPVVLYNGEEPWTAAASLADLQPAMPEDLKPWQPELRYLLIDEQSYAPNELAQRDNLVAALIRAELADSPEALSAVLASLIVWFRREDQQDLLRAFNAFFRQVLARAPIEGLALDSTTSLMEMQNMLSQRIKQWGKSYIEQGRLEGLEEGREEGIGWGEARSLRRLLIRRFGPLPSAVAARIDAASRAELECWLDRILDAGSLTEVFEPRENG